MLRIPNAPDDLGWDRSRLGHPSKDDGLRWPSGELRCLNGECIKEDLPWNGLRWYRNLESAGQFLNSRE
ncbi:hypothetical protein SCOR_30745 [Sulfidibacter corallicola]